MQRKVFLIIISILILTLSILGITYAFMRPQVEEKEEKNNITINACAKIQLKDNGNAINLENTYPMDDDMGLKTKPYEFTVASTCEDYVGFNLYLTSLTDNEIEDNNIHFAITGKEDTVLVSDILSKTTNALIEFNSEELNELDKGIKGTHKNIYKVYFGNIPLKGESNYKLYLWVDKDASNDTMGKSFKLGLSLKSYIRSTLYEDSCDKNLATCQIAQKVFENNTLFFHNENLKNSANDLSYRFSGSSDKVDNYVCLDNKENGSCEADNDLYRIIGIFKNEDEKSEDYGQYEIKLIKSTPYEGTDVESGSNYTINGKGYRWSGSSTNQKNTWKDSTLNTVVLNQNYLQSLPSNIQEKIVMHTYITGGNYYGYISQKKAYEAYQAEIKDPQTTTYATSADKTTNVKIGLLYASDYAYAADQKAWATKTLLEYRNSVVTNNNWLYINDKKTLEWTITRYSSSDNKAFYVYYSGDVDCNNPGFVYNILAVRPVFYLASSTVLKSGNGTKIEPFRFD